jgi:hypothetical protein
MLGYIFIIVGLVLIAYVVGHLVGYAEAKYDEKEKKD